MLISTIAFMLIVILGWVLFKRYRKKSEEKKRDLEVNYSVTRNKLHDQLEGKIIVAGEREIINKAAPEPNIDGLQNQDFFIFFNIDHPIFKEKMTSIYPKLTQTDLNYCACILAGLSIYQAAKIIGVTPSAFKKARTKFRSLFKCKSNTELALFIKRIDEAPIR